MLQHITGKLKPAWCLAALGWFFCFYLCVELKSHPISVHYIYTEEGGDKMIWELMDSVLWCYVLIGVICLIREWNQERVLKELNSYDYAVISAILFLKWLHSV